VFYEFGKKGYKICQYIIVSVELYSRIALLFLKKRSAVRRLWASAYAYLA